MDRTFYCDYDTLRKYCDDENSWQFRMLKSLPAIRVQKEVKPLPKSFDEFQEQEERNSDQSYLSVFEKRIQRPVIPIKNLLCVDYSQICNSIFLGLDVPQEVREQFGVEVLSEELKSLQRHWFESVSKGNRSFTWKSFFKEGKLPASNSVIIMDRYLFTVQTVLDRKTKKVIDLNETFSNGGRNIGEILKAIIPDWFLGEYHILIVFDDAQIESKITNDGRSYKTDEVLKTVSGIISESLEGKKCSINLEYLAIHTGENYDPKSDTKDFIDENKFLKDLYNLTHDRRIITNYYMVNATHGWNAIDLGNAKKSVSKETQLLLFDALCSGIDNLDQIEIRNSIPIDYIEDFIGSFVKKLTRAKVGSYGCYHFSKEGSIESIGINQLRNNVLRLTCDQLIPQDWGDVVGRCFSRDL